MIMNPIRPSKTLTAPATLKILPCTALLAERVTVPGAREATIRVLIGPNDGAPNFAMRLFELAPGGHTPKHSHSFEHEVFILEGTGVALDGDRERPIGPGMAIFVPPDRPHQFHNTGSCTFRFLCLIPNDTSPATARSVTLSGKTPPTGTGGCCPCGG